MLTLAVTERDSWQWQSTVSDDMPNTLRFMYIRMLCNELDSTVVGRTHERTIYLIHESDSLIVVEMRRMLLDLEAIDHQNLDSGYFSEVVHR
mmetsp:Transcript_7870/g.10811  ORF Transcript_7870/g.10811 Transcript_7870/m.10811 type:complete len:92 (+) Transcript_7870:367-642(+)